MIPRLEKNKVGPTVGYNNADEVINSKLEEGLHLLIQPGQYNL